MDNKKDLVNQIRKQEAEIKKLKRELSKYRKYSNKFADIVIDSWNDDSDDRAEKNNNKIIFCESCGKGETSSVSFLGINFVVCQLCKFRKKIS
jgi:hypothetical protein